MIGQRWLRDIDSSAIQTLDPLGLDGLFQDLPRLNRTGDEPTLRRALNAAAAALDPASVSVDVALAAMRDLGMLLASVRRLAGSTMDLPEPVLRTLVALGATTNMPPRETVMHYCSWNPEGARRRTFTGSPEEHALISTTATCVLSFEQAARTLLAATSTRPHAGLDAGACRRAASDIAAAAAAVRSRGGSLDARHFATTLRHYFDPVTISGRSYSAAAAAQAPLYLVDECVFGRTWGDPAVADLRGQLAEYGLPRWRAEFRRAEAAPSLLATLAASNDRHPEDRCDSVFDDALDALRELLDQLVSFRGRHRRLVATAYDHTSTRYQSGSAGGDLQLVDRLLLATRRSHRGGRRRRGACPPATRAEPDRCDQSPGGWRRRRCRCR